jgi:hypothetical protein
MIFGLLAIPILSVSSAALLADVASTTDPAAAVVGIPATLGGLVMGALVFRLARVAHSGAVAVRAVLLRLAGDARLLVDRVSRPSSPGAAMRPALLLVASRQGQRGPPVSLR